MAERTVSVRLQAKVDQYVSGMKQANAVTGQMQKAAERTRKEQVLLQRASQVAGVAIAAAFAKKITTAASDLNETVSKSTVVFGKNAAAVQSWAKTSATSFGMSQNAALGAASSYGNLFVSLGLAADKSAVMSTKLVELAGDLASFNNIDPTVALDALRSGLVGETEPLRALGVNMNDATLRAQALKMGLDATTATLSPAVKAQAAYALILEQTTTAQGDFARTSDGLANQQRILNAQWADAEAALGQALLPAATDGVKVLNDMLGIFNALPTPVKTVTVGVLALGAAAIIALPKLIAFKAALETMGPNGMKASNALKGAGSILMGPWGVALAGATIAIGAYVDAQNNATEASNAFAASLDEVSGAATEQTFKLIADQLSRDISMEDWKQIPFTMGEITAAVVAGGDAYATMVARVEAYRDAQNLTDQVQANSAHVAQGLLSSMENQTETAYDGARAFEANRAATEAASKAQTGAALTGADAARGFRAAGGAAKAAESDVVDLETALKRFRGQSQTVAEANASLEQAFDDAAKAAKEMEGGVNKSRTALDLNTQAGRDGQDALFGIVDGAFDMANALKAAGASTNTVRARTMDARIEFIQTAKKMGLSETAAKDLADRMKLIPTKIATTMEVNNRQALAAVDAVLARWQDVLDMPTAVLEAHYGVTPPKKKKAAGGPITGAGTGTSDSIPILASNGEWVIQEKSARKYGPNVMAAINAGTFAKGGRVGYATGGKVQPQWDTGFRDQMRSGATVVGFDFNEYSQAVDRAKAATRGFAAAQTNLADARRKVNEAGSPEEQAQAMRDLAQAESDAAAAKREVAAADKAKAAAVPSGKNILARFKDRAHKLDNFRKNLALLRSRGLSMVIIGQLLEAGIDDGGEMAAALVRDGNITQLNATQAAINKDSAALAFAYGPNPASNAASGGGSTTGTTGTTAQSVVLSFENASKPVIIKMDSTQVWKGLLELKRGNGGAALGLS